MPRRHRRTSPAGRVTVRRQVGNAEQEKKKERKGLERLPGMKDYYDSDSDNWGEDATYYTPNVKYRVKCCLLASLPFLVFASLFIWFTVAYIQTEKKIIGNYGSAEMVVDSLSTHNLTCDYHGKYPCYRLEIFSHYVVDEIEYANNYYLDYDSEPKMNNYQDWVKHEDLLIWYHLGDPKIHFMTDEEMKTALQNQWSKNWLNSMGLTVWITGTIIVLLPSALIFFGGCLTWRKGDYHDKYKNSA